MARGGKPRWLPATAVLVTLVVAQGAAVAGDLDELREELRSMKAQLAEMKHTIEKQAEVIHRLEDRAGTAAAPAGAPAAAAEPAATALDRALEEAKAGPGAATAPSEAPVVPSPGALALGGSTFRLIDLSMDTLLAAGWSTATDSQLETLEAGDHDPRRRGFTLQQAELSTAGAVDPYFTGQAHIVFTDHGVELEEAFLTTQSLPYGLQVRAGHFFTEFGRLNPMHPHTWDWMDQPVVLSRFFGADGLRNPGARVSWLIPVPWYAALDLGAQNADGATAVSFLGEGYDIGGEAVGVAGRPIDDHGTRNLGDLLYLTRLVNGLSLTDSLSAQGGASALFGPNASGPGGRTTIYGADLVAKWRPVTNFRGWPYVVWQSEILRREWGADPASVDHAFLPGTTLDDWGLYTQLLWGFRYGWAAGLRYEYATGSGPSVGGREHDPFRDDRHRVSPLLSYRPSEFSRLRLQYDFDHAEHLPGRDAHSVWLGLEIMYGKHPAHSY
jgi:hypothetical protein